MFDTFRKLAVHPIKFRLFLLAKLPAAFFCGVRVRYLSRERAEVTVPYWWLTTNPFRSTYFACLSMAAEMSTGALAMAHLYKRNPPISMLIVANDARFFKKATGKTNFSCEEGQELERAISESIQTGESREVTVTSTGKNELGEIVAVFRFTWSFKSKNYKV